MVVDTSAIMAILLEEPDAATIAEHLAGASAAVMAAASYVELRIVGRSRGQRGEAEIERVLVAGRIEVVAVSAACARLAAAAYDRFGKGRHPAKLNFGDCFAYGLAKERGEPLLFKGDDFTQTDIAAA